MPVRSDAFVVIGAIALFAGACSSADIDLDAAVDAGSDTAIGIDSSPGDTGAMDSSPPDTSVPDTGVPDTSVPDTGPIDTGTLDAPDGGFPVPAPGDIVISELMPDSDAAGDMLGEWFELHNPSTTTAYGLDGCRFYDRGGTTEMPTGVVLAPGAYLSFAISASPGFTPDYVYTSGMRLANPPDPDSLTLECDGSVVDMVAYEPYPTWPWGQGESLSLDPDFLNTTDNDDVTSWCAGVDVYNTLGGDRDRGTPGMPNPEC